MRLGARSTVLKPGRRLYLLVFLSLSLYVSLSLSIFFSLSLIILISPPLSPYLIFLRLYPRLFYFLFFYFFSLINDWTIDTIASRLYGGESSVSERHRHRYEVNPLLVDRLEEKGLIFSGKDVTKERMEIVELSSDTHPYFLAVQFHPEFQSRPQRPSPSFLGFLTAIKKGKKSANE